MKPSQAALRAVGATSTKRSRPRGRRLWVDARLSAKNEALRQRFEHKKQREQKRENLYLCSLSPREKAAAGMRFAPHWMREVILLRDSYKCRYCKSTVTMQTANIDHVIPYPSGLTIISNLVTACQPCNHQKGSSYRLPIFLPETRGSEEGGRHTSPTNGGRRACRQPSVRRRSGQLPR